MKTKWILIAAAAALLAFVGWRVWQAAGKPASDAKRGGARAVPVAVEPVRRDTVRDVAEFSGSLLPRTRYVVAPKVPGRLERLFVNIGDAVTNGAPIALLDAGEYDQQAAQARAELEVSRAALAETRSALDTAAREVARVRELRAQKVASEAELDESDARHRAAEARLQVAEAQIRQREAALKTAEVRLSYTRILAAWTDGNGPRVVSERFVDEGAMLKANDPIVAVVDAGTVLAIVHVIEKDYPGIRVGQTATAYTDAHPGRVFSGRIVRRAPVLREESRQARVEIEIPNADGALAPGMFVRVQVQFAERAAARLVPAAAVVKRDGRAGVFLADLAALTARFVPVRTGVEQGGWTEIVEPPLEGSVVTLGQHLLQDGAAISLPPAVAPAAAGGKPEGKQP